MTDGWPDLTGSAGAGETRNHGEQRANGTGAHDQHPTAVNLGAARRVEADAERLGKRRLRGADLRANRNRVLSRHDEIIGETALHVRKTHRAAEKAHICAVNAQAGATELAPTARHRRIDGNQRPKWRRGGACTMLDDAAGNLVPERQRFAHAHGAEAAVPIIVQVGAADTAALDLDHDLPRSGDGPLPIIDPQIPGFMQDNCAHRALFRRGSARRRSMMRARGSRAP